jgi:hypothetical protein
MQCLNRCRRLSLHVRSPKYFRIRELRDVKFSFGPLAIPIQRLFIHQGCKVCPGTDGLHRNGCCFPAWGPRDNSLGEPSFDNLHYLGSACGFEVATAAMLFDRGTVREHERGKTKASKSAPLGAIATSAVSRSQRLPPRA